MVFDGVDAVPRPSCPPPGRSTRGGRLLSRRHTDGSGWTAAAPWWSSSTLSEGAGREIISGENSKEKSDTHYEHGSEEHWEILKLSGIICGIFSWTPTMCWVILEKSHYHPFPPFQQHLRCDTIPPWTDSLRSSHENRPHEFPWNDCEMHKYLQCWKKKKTSKVNHWNPGAIRVKWLTIFQSLDNKSQTLLRDTFFWACCFSFLLH